jgi:hypothetical protein
MVAPHPRPCQALLWDRGLRKYVEMYAKVTPIPWACLATKAWLSPKAHAGMGARPVVQVSALPRDACLHTHMVCLIYRCCHLQDEDKFFKDFAGAPHHLQPRSGAKVRGWVGGKASRRATACIQRRRIRRAFGTCTYWINPKLGNIIMAASSDTCVPKTAAARPVCRRLLPSAGAGLFVPGGHTCPVKWRHVQRQAWRGQALNRLCWADTHDLGCPYFGAALALPVCRHRGAR